MKSIHFANYVKRTGDYRKVEKLLVVQHLCNSRVLPRVDCITRDIYKVTCKNCIKKINANLNYYLELIR